MYLKEFFSEEKKLEVQLKEILSKFTKNKTNNNELIKKLFENFKPTTIIPFQLIHKPYFKEGVKLPFSVTNEDLIMLPYLIFSEKPSINDNTLSSIETPLKNIHLNSVKNNDNMDLNISLNNDNMDLNDSENEIYKDNFDDSLNNLNDIKEKNKDDMDFNLSVDMDTNEKEINKDNLNGIEVKNENKLDEKPIKIIIGVSGIGKTSHVISKIFSNSYLIYLSCGDVSQKDFQMYDSNTQIFISKCDTFYNKIVKHVDFKCIQKNEINDKQFEIDKQKLIRKIMVNYVSYYFLLRLLYFLYLKEILKKNAKEIFFSQINGNSANNNIVLDFIIDNPSFYEEFDFDTLITKFNYLKEEDIIFVIDELQLLTYYLTNKFIGRNNTSSLRSLLSIFSEAISKFTFLLRYLLGYIFFYFFLIFLKFFF
jgi:hypothetical protein